MKFLMKKSFTLIITLLIVSFLAFLAFAVIPGDLAERKLGTSATEENLAQLREELGLNDPVLSRYMEWLTGFVQGDMGESYSYGLPVEDMIAEKLPITGALVLLSILIVIALSFPIGIFTARRAGGRVDQAMTVLNQICMSIPPVFVGILMIYVFGNILRVFQPGMYVPLSESPSDFFIFMLFPALSIALSRVAMTVKLLRSSLLEEMNKNYIRTAYSRGHSRSTALSQHALRNAVIPVIVFIAVSATEVVAGSVIIEQVFAIPGIGRLLIASISSGDYPVVLAIVMILATWVVLVNFIADLLSQYIDPRVRLG